LTIANMLIAADIFRAFEMRAALCRGRLDPDVVVLES